VFGIQIGYHRLIAHRAFVPRFEWIRYVLAILGTAGLLGGPVTWAQYHRTHHAFSDTDKDPQNINKGRWYAHYGWLLSLMPVPPMVVKDIIRDKRMIFIDRYCRLFPLAFLCLCLTIDTTLFVSCLTAMVIACQVDMSINSLVGHSPNVGLKNNLLLSVPTAGTSLHKNHHDAPKDYNFGKKWYEVDPCRYIVPILSK